MLSSVETADQDHIDALTALVSADNNPRRRPAPKLPATASPLKLVQQFLVLLTTAWLSKANAKLARDQEPGEGDDEELGQ